MEKRRFNFSFRFYRQTRYFEIGGCEQSWFVTVFEKLAELSSKYYEEVMGNLAEKDAWRIHPIEWSAKNIPIKRSDLSWIDQKYLDNKAEYEFVQFQLTTGLGRVIGFWDELRIFNVVLLDPLHNAQPSKRFNYQVQETFLGKNALATALTAVELSMKDCGEACRCRAVYGDIQSALTSTIPHDTILVPMQKELFATIEHYIGNGVIASVTELIEGGISQLPT